MQTFRKEEKLKSKKIIDQIFISGQSLTSFPLKLYFLKFDDKDWSFPKIGVSVPKKNFKNAVDRNRLKRRIREAYRKNRHTVFGESGFVKQQYAILFVYLDKEEIDYQSIEDKIIDLLYRLKAKHEKSF